MGLRSSLWMFSTRGKLGLSGTVDLTKDDRDLGETGDASGAEGGVRRR